ncbi:MAG TPA: anti-sigma factor domain-containing protein [Clostridia bacterium]
MKAVIVDVGEKYSIALTKKGQFVKIKSNDRLKVGYEVDALSPSSLITNTMRIASVAASLLFISGIGLGYYFVNAPYSYVDVDINPSIEITSNIFDRIIKIEALNDDGKNILKLDQYNNESVEEGVQNIIKRAAEKGYIKNDVQNVILVTVSSKDEKKVENIKTNVSASIDVKKVVKAGTSAEVMMESTTLEKHDSARKMGMSPGKLSLIEEVIKEKPGLKVDDLKNKPVRDLVKSIDEDKKDRKKPGKIDSGKPKPIHPAHENNNVDKKEDPTDKLKRENPGKNKLPDIDRNQKDPFGKPVPWYNKKADDDKENLKAPKPKPTEQPQNEDKEDKKEPKKIKKVSPHKKHENLFFPTPDSH